MAGAQIRTSGLQVRAFQAGPPISIAWAPTASDVGAARGIDPPRRPPPTADTVSGLGPPENGPERFADDRSAGLSAARIGKAPESAAVGKSAPRRRPRSPRSQTAGCPRLPRPAPGRISNPMPVIPFVFKDSPQDFAKPPMDRLFDQNRTERSDRLGYVEVVAEDRVFPGIAGNGRQVRVRELVDPLREGKEHQPAPPFFRMNERTSAASVRFGIAGAAAAVG